MLKADQIPDEVVLALWEATGEEPVGVLACLVDAKIYLAAAINAWPSAFVEGDPVPTWISRPAIILPLPQEGEETDWGQTAGQGGVVMIDDGMPVGDPKDRQITALRAEVEDLGNRLHHVHRLWANNEHALRAENERLRAELREMDAHMEENITLTEALRHEQEWVLRLSKALRGIIRVADRNTVEFNEARAALGEKP